MKNLIVSLLVLFFSLSVTHAGEYDIDPAHSFINFRTKHLGLSWLAGRFNAVEGTINYDSANAANQSVKLTIDIAALDTNHAERDKHLRGQDFFDVEKFPTATFVSSGYEGDAQGGTLFGALTLHGVTKNIAFDIKRIGEGKDPWGGYRAGFEGHYRLLRADFDMGYDLGPAAEEVELDLFVEGIKKQ